MSESFGNNLCFQIVVAEVSSLVKVVIDDPGLSKLYCHV